jgi:hypothetical protein
MGLGGAGGRFDGAVIHALRHAEGDILGNGARKEEDLLLDGFSRNLCETGIKQPRACR